MYLFSTNFIRLCVIRNFHVYLHSKTKRDWQFFITI
jgi:hypothetical protein